ncbi:CU044_2847 family protein [Streptomyces iconiensis]|uniref:CU044_2847 family protein n=1 Tax=Streptomyces iconiensis TaxID=1384038 RepID=A0ABT7A909_9ACTN|nr:CU044_2847 family protein [Streptomyces iconiensis]MDJ1137098.1 CU044_2847 family protein [Streptomyces iconiensis]
MEDGTQPEHPKSQTPDAGDVGDVGGRPVVREEPVGRGVPDVRAEPVVRVETVELDARGGRQIGSRTRASSLLDDRSEEIQQAIVQASALAQDSLAGVPERGGWSVSSVEVTFGLTLAAEAGVILSKASAEASFEVTLTVERGGGQR